ncbi:MAG: TPM domain-containing protein [Ottowia sp.]|uniref:TPM domain-containing protein n=1 Tax=unclassified Ottowia TaxID=2645081 RepID=UPI003C2DEC76
MKTSTLTRLLRHRWLDESDARRAVPPDLSERLQRRVAASERRHTGEVRIYVEGSLPLSYLWRHLRDKLPIEQIVRERAVMIFSKLRMWDTAQSNGVLIYLLLAEHAIELVADRGVSRHVPAAEWQAMVDRLGSALRENRFEDGLTQALEEVSAVLVEHFPEAPGSDEMPETKQINQLPDTPVLR